MEICGLRKFAHHQPHVVGSTVHNDHDVSNSRHSQVHREGASGGARRERLSDAAHSSVVAWPNRVGQGSP